MIFALILALQSAAFQFGQPLPINPAGPGVTLEAARAMTPAELADRVLPKGHLRIVRDIVRPWMMDPPSASLTEVHLISAPGPLGQDGLCEGRVYTVYFEPVDPNVKPMFTATPMRPARLETQPTYVLGDTLHHPGGCGETMFTSFNLGPPEQIPFQRGIIRLFAQAVARARAHQPLGFDVLLNDPANPAPLTEAQPQSVARAALAALDLNQVTNVGLTSPFAQPPFSAKDVTGPNGAELPTARVSLTYTWTADMVLEEGRITRMVLRHDTGPPPPP